MTVNFSSGLVGLSMLTGDTSLIGLASELRIESNAVRKARAQFTLPAVVAPWQEAASSIPVSTQVSNIKRMPTIIDKPSTSSSGSSSTLAKDATTNKDVQTSFIAYKALERLRMLAEAGAAKTTSSAERTLLQTAFAKGINDLQGFLAEAPSDKVKLSFGSSARRAESVAFGTAFTEKTVGTGLLGTRTDPLVGIAGDEVLEIKLSKYGVTETVTADLSTTTQPPTLDSVTAALNAAIASIPMRDIDGNVVNGADGNPTPKYASKFLVEKNGDKWGLVLSTSGVEQISLDQVNAKDALMVVTGQTALDAPATTQIMRFDDPAGTATRKTLGTLSAVDGEATDRAKLAADDESKVKDVVASTTARAITTDAKGNSYVVGTAAGDIGSNQLAGSEDLFLTKLDSEGKVVWQRTLGAASSAQGAAVTVGANGDIVVAGTVTGPFNGSTNQDSDIVVVKFDANGDETFATAIRAVGNEEATAVAVGADGTVFVGGKAQGGGGDAFLARIDATGSLKERRTIDSGGSDTVSALAVGADGELLALTRESGTARLRRLDAQALATDLGALDLGVADARVLAVSATGEIAVGGATSAALNGTQVNGLGGGRDGFVARIDADLTEASVSYLGTDASDEVDSIAFMGDDLYAGGRTTGALSGTARQGAVDGFVARIDAGSGAIENINQFGQTALRTEPVRIAAATGGAGITSALGFHRGELNPTSSARLVANTSLRAGDEFSLKVDGGTERKITILADDTLTTLANRIRKLTGTNVTVTTPRNGTGSALRIEPKAGHSISLLAGGTGKDALEKLGIEPGRFDVPAIDPKAQKVKPGGAFGLMLDDSLSIATANDAKFALSAIKSASSMTQTAFRSLYWDQMKANLVDGTKAVGAASAYQKAQLANYQSALNRLTSANTYTGF
ncbi:NHL repeat-containing protein [Allosphingosinicella deserti]|uniref:Regulatory protein FlaEY n=1 Tax=Allosphingosinicella deserti TaxID=2116704 RepID=A0A2P7QGK2_9SPHN|nr:hypothetical protein [Sphingomonas deserti]PSJ37070.1 hypothetical protein C7I55_23690 [Sphingomonas deserti]